MDRDIPQQTDAPTTPPPAATDGSPATRRPGEALFALLLLGGSLALLHEAYGISGFSKLSSPGTVPMATTAVMVICMVIVTLRTLRLPKTADQTVSRDILPLRVLIFAVMLVLYGLLLRPLGFIPTTALFLIAGIRILGRGWGFAIGTGLLALLAIWVIFRIVFTVLMPAGVMPEAEIIQFFRALIAGAG
ncbi:tripartite tricarboxylate transporter TctB family protein [Szabonella alba]|uniref:Tripartite tricarboxylate transporter TctB family protein n=1 Tax=Szabonella alba TaxID=2804194 RepID=A0A8K0VAE8_9RHOB|nr:tripartite tricarboxylate transporter TctB family protein [Szabonella alba]MBL4916588.1 tripartite tricarboxylate transporter TctB family protein [Szabonella alba]